MTSEQLKRCCRTGILCCWLIKLSNSRIDTWQTCHGADGKAPIMAMYPKLNGQNKEYLVAQMKDIKSGARNNGMSMAMKAMVATVTDEEFEAIADYLSKVQ